MNTNKYGDDATWIFNRISSEAEQGRAAGGEALVDATGIAARSQIASTKNKATEPVNRKERAQFNELVRLAEEKLLIEFAEEAELFLSASQFQDVYGSRKIGEGAEQQVYLNQDRKTVLKTNDAIMHGNWLEFFDRITIHNWLFPEVFYKLIGFTMVKERFAAILEQPFIHSQRGANREVVEKDLERRGFKRLRNDDYYSPTLGIILEDLHDENVLIMKGETLYYFDPVIYLETPEMKLKGDILYRFPFA